MEALVLEPKYLALRDEARAVATALEPFAVEADAMSTVHPDVHAELSSSGLFGVMVPAAYGGRDEQLDPVSVCVVREALMGTSAHADALFALQGVGSYAIGLIGSHEQRQKWLPHVLTGDALAAIALTEEHAGSDLKAIASEIVEDGDELVLNGGKAFISNACAAAFFTTLVRDRDGYAFVLVPADTPGVTARPSPELIAPHVLGDLEFTDVRLSASARIGRASQGFGAVLGTLSVFRAAVAAAAVGLAQAALDTTARHAADRHQFGRPLARLGAVEQMLADSWADVEMARLLTYRSAEIARDDPIAALPFTSMAKLAASEAAGRVTDRGVQIAGRFGLIRDAKLERLYRQARATRIYEGTSETLRVGIARSLISDLARTPTPQGAG